MTTRVLESITYKLIDPPKLQSFIEKMAKGEWEAADFEKYGDDLHKSQWGLQEVELSKIRMRPEFLASKKFQDDLRTRIKKQRQLHKNKVPITPIILRGADWLIFDGYARVHFLREIGVKKCLAYVGCKN